MITSSTLVEGMEMWSAASYPLEITHATYECCDCCPEHMWWRPDGWAHVCMICWAGDERYISQVDAELLEDIWQDEAWFKERHQ